MSTPSRQGSIDPEEDGQEEFVVLNGSNERVLNLDTDADADSPHATPAVIDDNDDDDDTGRRQSIDLDAEGFGATGSGGAFDRSALFGAVQAAQRQFDRQPTAPAPAAPAPSPASTFASSPDLDAQIKNLRAELEAERNKTRRAAADMVNFRRKSDQDRDRAIRDATERVIKQLLPIIDDFERSLSATVQTQSYEQLSDGVNAILRNFGALLGQHGVEAVESVGKLFDPDVHEAMGLVPSADVPDDTVIEELRKGYTLDGRLLRPAMVRVARYTPDGSERAGGEAEPENAPDSMDASLEQPGSDDPLLSEES